MAIRDLKFTIKVTPWGAAAQKDAGKLTAELKTQDKATKVLVESTKKHAKGVGEAAGVYEKFGRAGENAVRGIGTAMRSATEHVKSLTTGIEGAVKKVFNFKSLLMGSVVGAGAYKLGSSVFHEGFQQLAAENRAKREFGKDAPGLIALANKIGLRSGIQGDDALRGMTPIAEAIQETAVKGATFGGKRIKTDADITRAKSGATKFAGTIYQRLATLHSDIAPDDLGRILAAAGTGPEGLKSLGSALGYNKAFIARARRDMEKKHLGGGDAIMNLMNMSGDTEGAESARGRSFQHQVQSIGAQLTDSLGDVGKSAVEALNKKFGEGETLASKLEKAISSPKGKEAIEKMGQGLAKMVGFAADLALKIPAAFSWIEEHKTTLLAVAAGYGGLKVIGGVSSLVGGVPGVGGLVSKIPGVGDLTATPVRVVNWGDAGDAGGGADGGKGKGKGFLGKAAAVSGALAAGYAVGTAADEASGGRISDFLASALDNGVNAMREKASADSHQGRLAEVTAVRKARIAELESQGASHGSAVFQAQQESASSVPRSIQTVTNVMLDGLVLAKAVANHVVRDAKNATAGGAAR